MRKNEKHDTIWLAAIPKAFVHSLSIIMMEFPKTMLKGRQGQKEKA
jgi:hypothetical protein